MIELPTNRLSQYQRLQQIVQHFWLRWSKEYLSHVQQRCKWKTSNISNIKIGTMLLIKEDNTPPLNWKFGRIIRLYPGSDGVIRVVDIKTSSGVLKRSVGKICVLPIDNAM